MRCKMKIEKWRRKPLIGEAEKENLSDVLAKKEGKKKKDEISWKDEREKIGIEMERI